MEDLKLADSLSVPIFGVEIETGIGRLISYKVLPELNPSDALARRLFFACFVKGINWDQFSALVRGTVALADVISLVRKHYGEGRPADFPLVLSVDEPLLYIEKTKSTATSLLNPLTDSIDNNHLLVVMSSLSPGLLHGWSTTSQRPLIRAPLFPLRDEDVRVIIKDVVSKFQSQEFQTKALQVFDDTAGSPRFVWRFVEYFMEQSDDSATISFESMLLDAKTHKQTQGTLEKFMGLAVAPELRQSLVASVLGEEVRLIDYDDAVCQGLLIMNQESGTNEAGPGRDVRAGHGPAADVLLWPRGHRPQSSESCRRHRARDQRRRRGLCAAFASCDRVPEPRLQWQPWQVLRAPVCAPSPTASHGPCRADGRHSPLGSCRPCSCGTRASKERSA